MPSYTRNQPKDIVSYVRMSLTQEIYYGWKAKDLASLPGVTAADLAALGHIQAGNLPSGALSYFRASAPKPGSVRKVINKNPTAAQQGSTSTFFGAGFLDNAIAEGWNLKNGAKGVRLTNTNRTTTAIVALSNGLLYAFPLNTDDYNTYGAQLGLQNASNINTNNEIERLVSGTHNPRPGKAEIPVAGGGKFTSFYAQDQFATLSANGWSIVSNEVVA